MTHLDNEVYILKTEEYYLIRVVFTRSRRLQRFKKECQTAAFAYPTIMSATDCTEAIGKPIIRQARHSDKYKRIRERSKEEEELFQNIHTKLQDVIITSFAFIVF